MNNYELPHDYQPNPVSDETAGPYWTRSRIRMSRRYQYHVYALAAQIARRESRPWVADVGCGPGTKLVQFFPPPFEIHGFDLPEAIQLCHSLHSRGHFSVLDLAAAPGRDVLKPFDLIICADVIEHLADPCRLLDHLSNMSHADTKLVISTPERIRLHGADVRSPRNARHVREWSADEFRRFLESRGFRVLEQRFQPLMRLGFDLWSARAVWRSIRRSPLAHQNQIAICQIAHASPVASVSEKATA